MDLTNQKEERDLKCTYLSCVKPHNYLSAYYVHKIEGETVEQINYSYCHYECAFWKGRPRDGVHGGMESE